MPVIRFSEKDLLRDKIVPPSWYRVRVEDVESKISSKGDSTNHNLQGVILFDADTGSTEYAGVPFGGPGGWNFNTKVPGFAMGFLKALGVSPEVNKDYELSNAVGKELDVFVENGEWEGQIRNKVIKHKYRAPRS